MKAVILAAGRGTRLQPMLKEIPKPMAMIAGKPVLRHTVEWLVKLGITDITITVGHLKEVVMWYFEDGSRLGANISYSIEDKPYGTAGGVKKAMAGVSEPFIVWYGDNFSNCDLNKMADFHRAYGADATITVRWRGDVQNSGLVGWTTDNRLTSFVEKPRERTIPGGWVNCGMYILDPKVLDEIGEGEQDFGRDVFPKMIENGRDLRGYGFSYGECFRWYDTPEDLMQLRKDYSA
jgi:mannose-1-phosphate guanylyltransferase/phosphomannomutase